MTIIKIFDDLEIDTSKTAKEITKKILDNDNYELDEGSFNSIWVNEKQNKSKYIILCFNKESPSAKLEKITQYNRDKYNKKWYLAKTEKPNKIIWEKTK